MDHNIITHETIWTLSSPGTPAYGHYFQGEDQIFLVYENDSLWLPVTTMKNGHLYPGHMTGIERFEGQKAISSLPFIPLKFLEDREAVTRNLIERGKKIQENMRRK